MSSSSGKKQTTGLQLYISRPWELIKTVFMVLTWIVLGMHLELVGPTLKILVQQTGTTFAGISWILAARGGGYVGANLLGAGLQNIVKKYSEGLMTLAFLIASIVVLATPYTGSLIVLSILFFFQGVSQGLTDLGGTNLVLTMWGDHAAAPLNSVHLGYGIGAVFVNLLVGPFLSKTKILSSNSTITPTASIVIGSSANISIPYAITAGLCLLIAVGYLIFSIREHRTGRETLPIQQVDYAAVATAPLPEPLSGYSPYSPRSCGKGHLFYGLFMSILWIFYMFFVSANDLTFAKFFFSYMELPDFQISTRNALLGMVLYWLSYSIGRLICAIVSLFVPVYIALTVLWIGGLALAVTWIVYVWTIGLSITSLFILGSFTGLVFSPIYPLSFGFINQRLNVNPLLVGLLLCGGASGGIIFQKIAGGLMDKAPKHFPSLVIICVLMSISLYFAALILSSCHLRQEKGKFNHSVSTKIPPVSDPNDEEQQMANYLAEYQDDKL